MLGKLESSSVRNVRLLEHENDENGGRAEAEAGGAYVAVWQERRIKGEGRFQRGFGRDVTNKMF